MVCTVAAIKNSEIAAKYYSQTDNYYRDKGHAPTAWQGKGAEALGLRGEVTIGQARELLDGFLPNGERVGGDDHRPGWEMAFSAPKSVSIAAYIHGDDRLLAAHDEAVRDTLAFIEREVAACRIRENNEIRTEATANIVAATYRHDVSRDAEPDLHTHSVVMNITQSSDGRWRSLESNQLYRIQTEAGAVYRASLGRRAERLGWATEKTMAGDHESFELRDISAAERELFSSRSKAIEAELAKMWLTRKTATAEQKQIVALNTRQAKADLDRGDLLNEWREQHRAAGFEQQPPPAAAAIADAEYHKRADAALGHAIEHLSERESRFTERQIVSEARKVGMGQIDDKDIAAAVARAASRGELVATTTRQFDPAIGHKTEQAGFTTHESQEIERRILSIADAAIGAVQPAMSNDAADAAIKAQETATGFQFNDAQSAATRAILTGSDRVTLVQGYAGTAKTTSVLAASAAALRAQGYNVVALAPTHSAATTLGESIGAPAQTVAKFIHGKPQPAGDRTIYMVDEMSMLSARDTEKLLERTAGGRVVAVGDVKQLGSVGAGAEFRQLQEESKLPTQVLDKIVRQRNDQLRDAVHDSIRGNATAALDKLEVRELSTREERITAISSQYAELDRAEREKTIIIAPGRDDRREINNEIRAQLAARGEIGESQTVRALDKIDMTEAEQRRASSYNVNDVLEAARDYESLGLKRGERAQVVARDVDKNKLTIETVTGKQKTIDISRFTKLQAYSQREMQVAPGDRLVFRANSPDLKNGTILHVEKLTETHIHCRRDDNGKTHVLERGEALRIDHGYAQTGHESQGRTADGCLFHAESTRANLMNQQNFYVPISRAKDSVIVFTDDRLALAEQIERESGQKETALSRSLSPPAPTPAPAPAPAPWDAPEHVRTDNILVEQAPAEAVTVEPAHDLDFER